MVNLKDTKVLSNNTTHKYTLIDDALYRYDESMNRKLIQDDVEIYDVAVDSSGHHHVIVVLKSGVFNYLKEEQDCFKVKTLEKYPSTVNKIENINIHWINGGVHILYDFRIYGKNARNYNYKSFILHLYNKGTIWRKSNISTFTQSKPPRYHYTIKENGDLFYFKVLNRVKYTSLTPYRFSARKMTFTQSKEIKLQAGIGRLTTVTSSNSHHHFFFYSNVDNRLNYFNTDINYVHKSTPLTIYEDVAINIISSVTTDDNVKVLASYPDKDDEVIVFEHPYSEEYWDRIVYDLKIKPMKYVCDTFKITTFEGSDETQSILLLIDDYVEPKEEILEPIIEEIDEDILIDKHENDSLKNLNNINKEEIIFNAEDDTLNDNASSSSTDSSSLDNLLKAEGTTPPKEVIEPPHELIATSDISSVNKIKLQLDNILRKIGNYLTQND